MPNGGSDNCGTCWFNSKNKGEASYSHMDDPGESRCVIRNLVIENPLWTYCANHPHHNSRKVEIPVGPVYVCEDVAPPVRGGVLHGDSYQRRAWVDSPDTEEIRRGLVQLLEATPKKPEKEYPTETKFDHEIIGQLGAFRERGAVKGLRRVLTFNPDVSSGEPFSRDRRLTIGYAIEALALILGDEALEDITNFLCFGLEKPSPVAGVLGKSEKQDKYATIRYFAVKALAYCSSSLTAPLLQKAANDPHPQVAAYAREIIEQTRNA